MPSKISFRTLKLIIKGVENKKNEYESFINIEILIGGGYTRIIPIKLITEIVKFSCKFGAKIF